MELLVLMDLCVANIPRMWPEVLALLKNACNMQQRIKVLHSPIEELVQNIVDYATKRNLLNPQHLRTLVYIPVVNIFTKPSYFVIHNTVK